MTDDWMRKGNVTHLEMNGAGKPEPILGEDTHAYPKFHHLLS